MSHRHTLTEILLAFGEYYDRALSKAQIAMYVEDLMGLTPDELKTACRLYRQDPKNERFPLPAKLIAIARPQTSAEDIGRETAAKIIECLSKDGHSNADRARSRMGEFGWSIVSRFGGWESFCKETTNDNLPIIRAQIRDLASTMNRREAIEAVRSDNALPHDPKIIQLISKSTHEVDKP